MPPEALRPTCTPPKSTLVGAADSAVVVPVPDSVSANGPADVLAVSVPAKLPAVAGANVTGTVNVFPAFRVDGNAGAEVPFVNDAPEIDSELTVIVLLAVNTAFTTRF